MLSRLTTTQTSLVLRTSEHRALEAIVRRTNGKPHHERSKREEKIASARTESKRDEEMASGTVVTGEQKRDWRGK
jgi:hypothetical protein